jgi:C1A family cysteine protease
VADIQTLVPRRVRGYGYIPDLPDARDLLRAEKPVKLPKKLSYREQGTLGTPYNQGNLGSCTYNAIAKGFRHALVKQGKPVFDASRLFGYYGEREIEGTIDVDAGAMIRDGMKVASKLGMPDERLWPYDVSRFRDRPSPEVYADARQHQCLVYKRVAASTGGVTQALARGFPVVCGFTVYESFESDKVAQTGEVPNPKASERVVGGHAVLLTGFEQVGASYRLEWLNSWDSDWGNGGYFYTKSSFLRACHVNDAWTMEVTE